MTIDSRKLVETTVLLKDCAVGDIVRFRNGKHKGITYPWREIELTKIKQINKDTIQIKYKERKYKGVRIVKLNAAIDAVVVQIRNWDPTVHLIPNRIEPPKIIIGNVPYYVTEEFVRNAVASFPLVDGETESHAVEKYITKLAEDRKQAKQAHGTNRRESLGTQTNLSDEGSISPSSLAETLVVSHWAYDFALPDVLSTIKSGSVLVQSSPAMRNALENSFNDFRRGEYKFTPRPFVLDDLGMNSCDGFERDLLEEDPIGRPNFHKNKRGKEKLVARLKALSNRS